MSRIVVLELSENFLEKFNSLKFEIHPQHKKTLRIGEKLIFREDLNIGHNVGIYTGNYLAGLGHYSFSHSSFHEMINFETGNYVSIAENVQTFGFEHPTDTIGTSPVFYHPSRKLFESEHSPNLYTQDNNQRVLIGHDVWIGRNVLLKRGIKIGTGAVIGAGSVVTKDVSPFEIVAGNPAKKIRNRHNIKIQERLLASNWWHYSPKVLRAIDFNRPVEKILDDLENMINKSPAAHEPKVKLIKYLKGN